MKKSILAFAVLGTIMLSSCKKEEPTPTPVEPTPTTQYKLNFLAYDNPLSSNTFYSDVLVVINGDTLNESLSQHLTDRGHEDIEGDFIDSETPTPTNGLTYNVSLNTLYHIKIIDKNTKLLLDELAGSFKTEPNPATYDRDIYFEYTISETTNEPNAVTVTGNSFANLNEGMGEGNCDDDYFFTFVMFY